MAFFADMVRVSVSGTPGTGTITLGSAQTGFQTFAQAGVPDGTVVSYSVGDSISNGVYTIWEVGRGTYSAGTLTRGPLYSSNGGAAVSLTSSAAVWLVVLADDLTWTIGGNTAGAASGYMADLNLIGGAGATLSGNSNSITISGNTAASLTAIGNTTGVSSSSSVTLANQSISGAGIVSVGLTTTAGGGALIISASSSQSVQTIGGIAVGNTTGSSSSTTFDARSFTISGAGIASVGYSSNNVLIVSAPTPTASGTADAAVALGSTTGATSSSSLTLTAQSISGAGGVSVGFSTTAAGQGVLVISGATQTASATSMGMSAVGNTTGTTSSQTQAITGETISGAGIASVGFSGGSVIISASTSQSVQTLEGFAVGNTTGSSSNTTFDARSVTVSGAGVVSVGYSSNNVLIISAPAGGSGTAENMVALGNTTGATSSSILTLTAMSVSGAGGASVGFSTTAAGAGVLVISGGAGGGGGGTSSFYALGNTTAQSSSSTITGSLSISGVGALSVGYSTTAAGAPALILSAPNVSTLTGVSGISVATSINTISIGLSDSLSFFEPNPLAGGSTSVALPNGSNTRVLAPCWLGDILIMNELRVLATCALSIMSHATSTASFSASASMSSGLTAEIYSVMGGTSSNSYSFLSSTSVLFSLSQSLSGTSTAYTNAFSITYPIGTTTSSSVISGTSTSTVALAGTSAFSSWREIDIPFALTLLPDNYIFGFAGQTQSAGASAMSLGPSLAVLSRLNAVIGKMGGTQPSFFPGVGSLSSTNPPLASFDALSNVSSLASNWNPYFYLINVSS